MNHRRSLVIGSGGSWLDNELLDAITLLACIELDELPVAVAELLDTALLDPNTALLLETGLLAAGLELLLIGGTTLLL